MALRLGEKYPSDTGERADKGEPPRVWLLWLQQVPSLFYVVGGTFLIYQYWKVLHSELVLITGALFLAYGFYRFFLLARAIRRR